MHNKSGTVLNNLIGAVGGYIGYGGINNSFGIEFDTYYNNDLNDPESNHISYLQNGAMDYVLITAPIQDDSANVETGDWYCVRIVWKRSNGVDGYDLDTYTVETGNNSPDVGQLKLRASKHFASIGSLITGLVPDANGRALVTWGITAATWNSTNRHEIEFLSMFNENFLTRNAIKIVVGEGNPSEQMIFSTLDISAYATCGTLAGA